MTGAKFYPQHKDKCYCRLNSNATANNFARSSDFVKTKSVKYRLTEVPEFRAQYDEFEHLVCTCCKSPLNYSSQRYNYELNQRPLYERTENDFGSSSTSPKSMGNIPSRCSSVDLLLKSYNDEKINKIGEFRSNNSNDCISISNKLSLDRKKREMMREAQSHVCRHRFVLNERLQPVPVHKDEQGSSTCVKCSKSLLELNPFHVKNRLITSDKDAVSSISGAGRQEPILILEVQMDKGDVGASKKLKVTTTPFQKGVSVQGVRGVQPNNSLALRFQSTK